MRSASLQRRQAVTLPAARTAGFLVAFSWGHKRNKIQTEKNMNIFQKSPISRVLEDLIASPDGESTWWAEAISRGLQEETFDPEDGNTELPAGSVPGDKA